MKFSETWLRELIDVPVDLKGLTEQLTMAGLEVEGVVSCAGQFKHVKVARVTAVEAHPDADRLSLCQIDDGDKPKSVVCGASNVRVGGLYPYAGPGAELPGGLLIEKRKIKGVLSEGMLCSESELGLSDKAEGLMNLDDNAVPGMDVQDYLALNDHIIELSLTPNRGDCLSVMGIAREVGVLNNTRYEPPAISEVPAQIKDSRPVKLVSPEACPRYCGRIIDAVDARRKTPNWIVERLRRSDIRSLNILVDLTNYVMLEMGQPMHAFDNDSLTGEIQVRFAKDKEALELLDGQSRELNSNTLVIADKSGAIAMAGIMGGAATAVSEDTRTVFLESAFFSPQAIMGCARQYGLQTDASHRFERGVDPQLCEIAMQRLTALITEYCGGKPGPVIDSCEAREMPARTSIPVRAEKVYRVLGVKIPDQRVSEIFEQLGFTAQPNSTGWDVQAPSFRFDINIEADLIEELARIYGYDHIEGELPLIRVKMPRLHETRQQIDTMAGILVSRGYREIISYGFVDPTLQALICPVDESISLLNPISTDLAVMRQSLLPGLIQTLVYNLKRQQQRIRLFETGHIFENHEEFTEKPVIAGLIYGNIYPEQWDRENRLSDFYDIKADLESMLRPHLNTHELQYTALQHIALHPSQAAEVSYENCVIGHIGRLHPELQVQLDIPKPVSIFELDLLRIPSKNPIRYQKLSKFPSIRRDISVIIDAALPSKELIDAIYEAEPEILSNLELFDVYQGEGIDLGKKSLSVGLTFQRSSSTLTDEEADTVVSSILGMLHKRFGANLRE